MFAALTGEGLLAKMPVTIAAEPDFEWVRLVRDASLVGDAPMRGKKRGSCLSLRQATPWALLVHVVRDPSPRRNC
jgi:hypothetical protein